jgi:hypothetical protein
MTGYVDTYMILLDVDDIGIKNMSLDFFKKLI